MWILGNKHNSSKVVWAFEIIANMFRLTKQDEENGGSINANKV